MKKKYLSILISLLLFCSVGCERNDKIIEVATDIATETDFYETKVICDEEFFKLLQVGPFSFEYTIFDKEGNVAESQMVDNKSIKIDMLENEIIDIHIGMGTGIVQHRYYSIQLNQFSEIYQYVIAVSYDTIAYIDVPRESPMDGRHVIVQNIFDTSQKLGEFSFDFARIDTPVTNAEFLQDETRLQITYLRGEDQAETTEMIDLN